MGSESTHGGRLLICKADQHAGSGHNHNAAHYRHCGTSVITSVGVVDDGGNANPILEAVNEINDPEKGPTRQRLSHNVSRVIHPRDMLECKYLAQDEITQVFSCAQDMLGLLERDSFDGAQTGGDAVTLFF